MQATAFLVKFSLDGLVFPGRWLLNTGMILVGYVYEGRI